MHVIFVEPAFPRNQREFPRALHKAGAKVTAIGEYPLEALDDELKSWLHAYEQVSSVVNEGAPCPAVSQPESEIPLVIASKWPEDPRWRGDQWGSDWLT